MTVSSERIPFKLNLDQTMMVRGMLCLLIIFIHFHGDTEITWEHKFAVGFFFFMTAYGMFSKFSRKGCLSFVEFLKQHLIPLLVVYWVAIAIICMLYADWGVFWSWFLPMRTDHTIFYAWYIVAVVYFYIIFWASFRLSDFIGRGRFWIPFIVSMLYALSWMVYRQGTTEPLLMLPIGIALAQMYVHDVHMSRISIFVTGAIAPAVMLACTFVYAYLESLGDINTIRLVLRILFFNAATFGFCWSVMSVILLSGHRTQSSMVATLFLILLLIQMMFISNAGPYCDMTERAGVILLLGVMMFGLVFDTVINPILELIGRNSYEIYMMQEIALRSHNPVIIGIFAGFMIFNLFRNTKAILTDPSRVADWLKNKTHQ